MARPAVRRNMVGLDVHGDVWCPWPATRYTATMTSRRGTKQAEKPAAERPGQPPEMAELARRYLDLWQEEFAAIASDPASSEALGRWFASFGQQWADPAAWVAAFGGMNLDADKQDDRSSTDATARTPSAGSASGDGAGDVARLTERVAALERQMADLAVDSPAGGLGRAGKTSRRTVG